MRGLEASIQAEVPFREDLLISATQHLVIFRPLYETGLFSDGVQAEIRHWLDLQFADMVPRRAAFIHDVRDVQRALEQSSEGRREELTKSAIVQAAVRYVSIELNQRYKMTNTVDQCHRLLHGELPIELLEEIAIGSNELDGLRSDALEHAARNVLYGQLTTLPVGAEGVGVFYLAPQAELKRDFVKHIAAFLRGDVPAREPSVPGELGGLAQWAAELLQL